MRLLRSIPSLLLTAAAAAAQTGTPATLLSGGVPAGLTLPVRLRHEIVAGRTAVGTPVQAELTQRVPVSSSQYLPSGTELLGEVVQSSAANGTFPALLGIRFRSVQVGGHPYPVRVAAVAVANFAAVNSTADPCAAAVDLANPDPANWTTCQVGGDEVVRSGWSGPLIGQSTQKVGFADFHGVYANPESPGAVPHALGAFSADAAGPYGYGESAQLSSQGGVLTLSARRKVKLYAEDNLLLRVDPQSP